METRARFHWLPEIGLLLLGGFFSLRELGTFPSAWTDDSLFMIVARQLAEGRGYTFPILHHEWAYPYFLAVGPPLIFPVALSIQLLGFSVEAARIPMVLYIAATAVLLYLFTQSIADRKTAQWATALLLSLSAFINTGKTVMGEIPGFFFLLFGLLLMLQEGKSWKRDATIGLLFGLSVLTKLTYGLLYPALGLAWIAAVFRRDRREITSLTITGMVAVLVFVPWRLLEMMSYTGLSKDFSFLFSSGGGGFQILHGHSGLLLRPQFLYYGTMLFLGSIGLWLTRKRIHRSAWIVTATLITMVTLYFLSSFGWYRHVLPAHLLLIPFATTAVLSKLPKPLATGLLLFFFLGQAYWQWDYRGSSRNTAAAEAATYISENMQDTDLIIRIGAIYVRLEKNPHWLFLTNPILTSRLPKELVTLTEKQRCMAVIRGVQPEDGDVQIIGRKYAIIPPPDDCP